MVETAQHSLWSKLGWTCGSPPMSCGTLDKLLDLSGLFPPLSNGANNTVCLKASVRIN